MKRFMVVLLYAILGYVVSAVIGYFLVDQFSSNPHDRSVEAAMTGAFVFGPLGAVVVAFLAALFSGSRDPGHENNEG